jgi:NADPH:quinone reductase-like Zn-dependent oxidoreductase
MIPSTMRALQLESFDGVEGLFVRELATPQPRGGQVLVKMHTAAVNPSDLMFLRDRYGVRRELPTTPGFEGCGTVVAAGSVLGKLWVGRRVALATQGNFGTWAEYTIVNAMEVFPLRKSISDEQGAMMLVNPLTAWALMDRAVRDRHRGVLLNAANSALGRMIVRIAAARGLTSVAIVRQASQVDALKALGASAVVVSSADDFADQLADACRTHHAGIGFDAIAGPMTGAMLKALPGGSCVLVYGALSLEPVQVDVGTLLFGNRVVEGFWLSEWIRRYGTKRVVRAMIDIQGALAHTMTTEVLATYTLDQAAAGIRAYQNNMGAGKVVLRMV